MYNAATTEGDQKMDKDFRLNATYAMDNAEEIEYVESYVDVAGNIHTSKEEAQQFNAIVFLLEEAQKIPTDPYALTEMIQEIVARYK